jgi:hypothetical protein
MEPATLGDRHDHTLGLPLAGGQQLYDGPGHALSRLKLRSRKHDHPHSRAFHRLPPAVQIERVGLEFGLGLRVALSHAEAVGIRVKWGACRRASAPPPGDTRPGGAW